MKDIIITILLCTILSPTLFAKEKPIIIRHYQTHPRYAFGLKLLKLAMDKTGEKYSIVAPIKKISTESRGESLVVSGRLDIQFLSATLDREEKMISIKIPIYRGLLGMRLLLISKKSRKLSITSNWNMDLLKSVTAGHGKFWSDLIVYEVNDLKVVANPSYVGIFKQLINGRIDYFHRGVVEIWGELDTYKDKLKISENIMLFYKHPVFFYVNKTRHKLANLVKQGLEKALADGSYKKIFLEVFGELIKKSKLDTRKLIILKNPITPDDAPPLDTTWWSPEKYHKDLAF